MNSDNVTAQERDIRLLGICWMIYGIIRLIAAVWLVSFSTTATMMFGALLGRVPDPFTMMNIFHVIYAFITVLAVVCGILGLLAGGALLAGQKIGRTLALIAGFLSLPEVPLGITLGIYSLIVLIPMRTAHGSTVVLHDRASDLRGHPSAT